MKSIRHFLLISLLISITLTVTISAIGNYFLDKKTVQPYADAQLIKTANLIRAFLPIHAASTRFVKQKNNLLLAVLDKDGKLIWTSCNNFSAAHLSHYSLGFNNIQINNAPWHAYIDKDDHTQYTIIVAEPRVLQNNLLNDITRNNYYILLFSYSIFGLLIWIIVNLGLRSIFKLTQEISNRVSTYLEPVKTDYLPVEIKPLVLGLNQLFVDLKLAFERNKRFASDAAHELRTPLAAIKTQAQVALKAIDKTDQYHALQKIVEGVNRSSHIVAQLLILSRLSQEEELNDIKSVDLHKLATEIIAYLVPVALEKNIDIELAPPPKRSIILGNDVTLGILIRNIVDNAIRYTPLQGCIKIQILNKDKKIIFRVIDSGPGIPSELHERIFERFYRIPGTTAQGSGLGLAIVHQIAELHHATIKLSSPLHQGLQFDVIFSLPQ